MRRLLHALPLHHIHGAVVALHTAHAAGACVEFVPKFSPAAVWHSLVVRRLNRPCLGSANPEVSNMHTRSCSIPCRQPSGNLSGSDVTCLHQTAASAHRRDTFQFQFAVISLAASRLLIRVLLVCSGGRTLFPPSWGFRRCMTTCSGTMERFLQTSRRWQGAGQSL